MWGRGGGGGFFGGGGGGGGGGAAAASEQIHVFSRAQIRDLDRLAVEEFAMPSLLLMENAARGVASVIMEGLQGAEDPSVLIVCGPGNNGGDGLAVARHLANRSVTVAILLAVPESRITGDARTNLAIARKMGIPIFDASASPADALRDTQSRIGDPMVITDALLGTGVDRPASGIFAELIAHMNTLKAKGSTLVAIDVPSGLDCDTGLPAADTASTGPAVEADLTIALAGVKAGFLSAAARRYVGELVVVDIGAPRALIERLGRPLTHAH
ncbi:MAG TPA: NAD(P)H-hydrate epimerase [Phycisphaerales bacterium]|nr:NAD(P)H-hydrate epimerase [Phycisphaerales bacterium]